MHQIQPDSLGDVEDTKIKIDEGVFGKCKKKMYRGQAVAVKYFKAHAKSSVLEHEAKMIMRFDHPGNFTWLSSLLILQYIDSWYCME
jgi:hypothetical protein